MSVPSTSDNAEKGQPPPMKSITRMCSAAIVLLTAGVGALALTTGAANAAATSGEMAPVLGNVSAGHATIWSVVRDGYLDSTSLSVHVKNGTVPDTDGSGTN